MPLADPSVQGFNYDMAQGVEYTVDIAKPVGERIQNLRFSGRPLPDDLPLKVAVNSYRLNGGGGYSMWKGAKVVSRSDVGMRELLGRYIQDVGTIRPRVDDNWKLVPACAADPASVWPEPARAETTTGSSSRPGRPIRRALCSSAWCAAACGARTNPSASIPRPSSRAARRRRGCGRRRWGAHVREGHDAPTLGTHRSAHRGRVDGARRPWRLASAQCAA